MADEIYKGRLITLNQEAARLPDGRSVELDIVRHPGGAVICALDAENQVCVLRQYRHAAGGTIWELPAGCIDREDPDPITTAKRELTEEAGLTARDWQDLGSILPSPGFCDEVLHLYLARDLTATATAQNEDEVIEIHWLPLHRALSMAASGEIRDAKTVAALFRVRAYLD